MVLGAVWNISPVLQLQNWIPNLHTNAVFVLTSIPTWLASDKSDKNHKGLPWGLPTDQLPRHYSRCPIRSSYTKLISESSRGYRMTGGPEVWSALEDRKPRRLPGGVGGPALSLRLPRPRLTHSLAPLPSSALLHSATSHIPSANLNTYHDVYEYH